MKTQINPMQAEDFVFYPFMNATQCGAKTRSGTICQSPAVRDRRRCRMHGGTNKGAPLGNSNALKNGFSTKEVKQLKKAVKTLLNEVQN